MLKSNDLNDGSLNFNSLDERRVVTIENMSTQISSDIHIFSETTLILNDTFEKDVQELPVLEQTPDYVFNIYGVYVCLIFVTGIFQNAVTIFVFLREKRLRKVHNYFIVGLAFSDIGMCIFGNWMIIVSAFNRHWIFQQQGMYKRCYHEVSIMFD